MSTEKAFSVHSQKMISNQAMQKMIARGEKIYIRKMGEDGREIKMPDNVQHILPKE